MQVLLSVTFKQISYPKTFTWRDERSEPLAGPPELSPLSLKRRVRRKASGGGGESRIWPRKGQRESGRQMGSQDRVGEKVDFFFGHGYVVRKGLSVN